MFAPTVENREREKEEKKPPSVYITRARVVIQFYIGIQSPVYQLFFCFFFSATPVGGPHDTASRKIPTVGLDEDEDEETTDFSLSRVRIVVPIVRAGPYYRRKYKRRRLYCNNTVER